MEGFAKFVATVAIPLRLLNILGGIVSGIWLVILGRWSIIGYGLVALIASSFCLSLAIMPTLLFAAPAALLYEKGYRLAFYFFGFLATLYTMSVLAVWCMAGFIFLHPASRRKHHYSNTAVVICCCYSTYSVDGAERIAGWR